MPRPATEDQPREDRILFEIVVDAYNETERAISWYYYLQDKLQFPFSGTCRSIRTTSPLKTGQSFVTIGLIGRARRNLDALSPVIVHIEDKRSAA